MVKRFGHERFTHMCARSPPPPVHDWNAHEMTLVLLIGRHVDASSNQSNDIVLNVLMHKLCMYE